MSMMKARLGLGVAGQRQRVAGTEIGDMPSRIAANGACEALAIDRAMVYPERNPLG